jgi:hypothetical protein
MNQLKDFLQSLVSTEEQFDKFLQDGKYKKDLFLSRHLYGRETGIHQFGKKHGEYNKTFYYFYLDEDLPEIMLWETSRDIRKSLVIEEFGTYMNNEKQP